VCVHGKGKCQPHDACQKCFLKKYVWKMFVEKVL
jgi:hypothetical protein